MRPVGTYGEVRQALLQSAKALYQQHQAPTLKELSAHAQVGRASAMNTVKNMTRSGDLVIVGRRRVDHCAKPVAEYAPPDATDPFGQEDGWGNLIRCMGNLTR